MSRPLIDNVQSVSQLTRAIKNSLENEFRFVHVSGEISNLKTPFSGHTYFTLKDQGAQLRAVLFKQQRRFVDLTLKDGQEVVCFGRISLYEPRGEYQLVVDSVELFGLGGLQRAFERLKAELAEQGYFAAERKKPIPAFPQTIVVVSSPTGAAIHDFLKIARIRQAPVRIQLLPVRVQGQEAAAQIAVAIDTANRRTEAEVIVLCRGGGSLEDLWPFNERSVAEAIFRSAIPIVTGIGHETDFTIADFCADFRCPTPTAAAEKLVADTPLLRRQLAMLQQRLQNRMRERLRFLDQRLHHSIRLLGDMTTYFRDLEFRLQLGRSYLLQAITKNLQARQDRLQTVAGRLQACSPERRLDLDRQQLYHLVFRLKNRMLHLLEQKEMALGRQASLLQSVSPLATLARGYSIVRKWDQKAGEYRIAINATDFAPGEPVNVVLHRGQLDCIVKERK